MRAEPAISPLTLGICCAVVAGALALAPGRGPFPGAPGRGADIVALESEVMNRDQQSTVVDAGPDPDGVVDEVRVLGRMISRTELPEGDDGETAACTEDCGGEDGGGAQPPAATPTGPTPAETPSDATGGGHQADTGPDAPVTPVTWEETDGSAADDTSTEGSADADSCRSPRAVAARNDGPTDVEPPSPCSQGHDPEPCRGPGCDGRSTNDD